jgi:hypothetical protein
MDYNNMMQITLTRDGVVHLTFVLELLKRVINY